MQMTIAVSSQIFEMFPTFRRGIVVAEGLNNSGSRPELERLLEAAFDQARRQPIDLKSDRGSIAWREAHARFGSNPNRFPPSHIAMRKRVQNGQAIPFINPVVAVMNYNSLAAHTSVGGDDIDHVENRLELRIANGSEIFIPLFQEDVEEHPENGEVVYVDEAARVMCRRWNWRNSHVSRIRQSTTRMVMNIDGLGDDCDPMVVETRDRVAAMLQQFCDATVTTGLLKPETPQISFPAVPKGAVC